MAGEFSREAIGLQQALLNDAATQQVMRALTEEEAFQQAVVQSLETAELERIVRDADAAKRD